MFKITCGRAAILVLALSGVSISACGDRTPVTTDSAPNTIAVNRVIDARDVFVGEFAYEFGGKPAIKITKEGGAYFVSTLDRGVEWTPPLPLATATQEQVTRVFGDGSMACVESGLVNERGFGMFKARQGCTVNKVSFQTGYYFLLGFARSDAYKL
jgi:hypothetical protein